MGARSRGISASTSRAIRPWWCRTCRRPAGSAPPTTSTTSRPRTAPSSRCSRTRCRSSRSSRTSRRSSTPRRFGWLGTPSTEVALYMFWHTSKIMTVKDAQTQEYVAGAAGAASTPAFYGRVFNQLFNFKARFIVGYPGQNEILHALEAGEVEAMASPFWSCAEDLAADLVQGEESPLPVPVWRRRTASGAQGRAARARSAADRGRQDAADGGGGAARRSDGRSARRPASRPTGSPRCAPP